MKRIAKFLDGKNGAMYIYRSVRDGSILLGRQTPIPS